MRADILLKLGYPELALGDCHRAQTLLDDEDHLRSNVHESVTGDDTTTTCVGYFNMDFWLQTQRVEMLSHLRQQLFLTFSTALALCNCFVECQQVCRAGLELFPAMHDLRSLMETAGRYGVRKRAKCHREDGYEGPEAMEVEEIVRQGSVGVPLYPWMKPEWVHRDAQIDATLHKLISEASNAKCTVKRVTAWEVSSNMVELCVRATTDLKAGEIILIEPTAIGTSFELSNRCNCCWARLPEEPMQFACCSDLVCSQACLSRAMNLYHPVICGRDLSLFYYPEKLPNMSADSKARMQVLLRMLAVILNERIAAKAGSSSRGHHPLLARIMNQLSPPPREVTDPVVFSFRDNVVYPFSMLRALGVNIFEDMHFDTWVMQVMISRLNNNQHGKDIGQERGAQHMALSPLYSLFNHGCAPNVVYRSLNGSTTIEMRAYRDIHQGGELLISYLKHVEDLPLACRRIQLRPWFGCECQCERCTRESGKASLESVSRKVHHRSGFRAKS